VSRGAERTLVARCPDWPLVAAGVDGTVPVVVVVANRVVASSAAARAEGVGEGLRRREAQGRCPHLVVLEADPAGEARGWEPVVAAVEAFAVGVEVVGPGTLALATRGPSRYFGGDRALADKVVGVIDDVLGRPDIRVGVADGLFAATLATRVPVGSPDGSPDGSLVEAGGWAGSLVGAGGRVLLVPTGGSRAWLASWPVTTLTLPELTGLLARLGIGTLGELAALPAPTLLGRFGPAGSLAHRLARGLDEIPLAGRTPPDDLAAVAELDPPAERVDTVAFVAKVLADELHQSLAERGLACTRVAIEAETEHGEHLLRRWRHDGALTAGAIAERVRWQLDSWLTDRAGVPGGTTGGLTLLRLTPDEVRPDHGRQLGFWGGSATGDRRVARTLARVQGMLGPDEVVTGVVGGGRDPADQVALVPWGDPREPVRPGPPAHPWPGHLPGPAPAVVHPRPTPVEVLDHRGRPVEVTGRGAVSASPATVSLAAGPPLGVSAWAGPWPVEERWWDAAGRRRARFQMALADGSAHLVVREGGRWWVAATYD
jgi:protein ImuB